jgi:formylglycine-generating enzyme required for sulfatase activity
MSTNILQTWANHVFKGEMSPASEIPHSALRWPLKTPIVKSLILLPMTVGLLTSPAFAQAPPLLNLQRESGLFITGTQDAVYAIETTTNLASSWGLLAFVKITTNPTLVPGTIPSRTGCRFYRSVPLAALNMVFVPAGAFQFGSPSNEVDRFSNEGPQASVTISKGFLMATYPVTQQEYEGLTGINPSFFSGHPNKPVEQVSWFNATNYCRLLTQQELAAGRIPAGWQYRLPTEAEWEYACRAGTSTRFSYGDDPGYASLGDYAWYSANSGNWTQEVGQKLPNPWGLYDMHGNVWEWCQDWYGLHPGGSQTDPRGPATGTFRVLRGGSWLDFEPYCRSACRISDNPAAVDHNGYGFRVVLAPGP